MKRQATEDDFRKPEFRGQDPEDYEVREDGVTVRKDRWEGGIRRLVYALGMGRFDFEVHDVVSAVNALIDRTPDRDPTGLAGIADAFNKPIIDKLKEFTDHE